MIAEIRMIQRVLVESADLVALAVCRRTKPKTDSLTRRQLYAQYEHGWLDYHIQHGNIIGEKSGSAKNSPILYSRLQVEALRKAESLKAKIIP